LTDWLQPRDIEVNGIVASKAVEIVARDYPFQPVPDYPDGLQHDGKARAGTWSSGLSPANFSKRG
jgi:hypothetical protein